jgi:hypothetical protein
MGTQTSDPGGQPKQTPPGKPGSQPPNQGGGADAEEGQEIPKTGGDPSSDPLEQDAEGDIPTDEDEDEDETGKIELPGEPNQREGARPDGVR